MTRTPIAFFLPSLFAFFSWWREKNPSKNNVNKIWPYFCSAEIKNETTTATAAHKTFSSRNVLFNGRLWLYSVCEQKLSLCVEIGQIVSISKQEKKRSERERKKKEEKKIRRLRCVAYGLVLPRIIAAFLSESPIRFFATFVSSYTIFFAYLFSCVTKNKKKKRELPVQKNSLMYVCFFFIRVRGVSRLSNDKSFCEHQLNGVESTQYSWLVSILTRFHFIYLTEIGFFFKSPSQDRRLNFLQVIDQMKNHSTLEIHRLVHASIDFDNHNILSHKRACVCLCLFLGLFVYYFD